MRISACKHGISSKRIAVFPYILNKKFTQLLPQKTISILKDEFGFKKGIKTIVILGGGDGLPKGVEIINALFAHHEKVQLAIVCGKNKALRREAEALKKKYPDECLCVFGFIDFVYELVNCADIVITKGGPATVLEILMLKKIPIINSYIWEQEKGNVEFVIKNKVGCFEPRVGHLVTMVHRIVNSQKIQKKYADNIKNLTLQNGTAMVSEYVYKFKKK